MSSLLPNGVDIQVRCGTCSEGSLHLGLLRPGRRERLATLQLVGTTSLTHVPGAALPNQSELVVCVMLTKLKERPVDAKSSFMTEIESSIWESLSESIVS